MKHTREYHPHIERFNIAWHYDTVNMLQYSLLLNNVTESGTHMQVAIGDHKRHRTHLHDNDYWYSDEYIDKNLDIAHCVGPKGTLYLFDSNAVHRLNLSKNSLRLDFKVMFTPGNNNLYQQHGKQYKLQLKNVDLSSLSEMQKISIQPLLFG